jgi:hypothetical protein
VGAPLQLAAVLPWYLALPQTNHDRSVLAADRLRSIDVHETTCGLVEMLGFAVDVFRPELPRQDAYGRACGGRP